MVACGDSEWYFSMNTQVDHQEYYCREDGSGEDWMENLKEFKHEHKQARIVLLYDRSTPMHLFNPKT